MTIKPQSFFSDLISKSKRLDERQKRLRLREKRLIQYAEKRRVTISDFFGESVQSQEPMMPKGSMGGDPLKILKEFTGKTPLKFSKGGEVNSGLVASSENKYLSSNENLNSVPTELNTSRTRTFIQPIVEKQIQTVQSPVPIPTPSKPKIIKVSKSNLPPSVASLLK